MPGDNSKLALIDSLNGLLADLFTLYLKTKNFHWHVAGPQFRDLHLLFDDQATELFALTDLVAERVRKNGGSTLTSIGAIGAKATIADDDRSGLDALTMVRVLRDDNAFAPPKPLRVKRATMRLKVLPTIGPTRPSNAFGSSRKSWAAESATRRA